mmetsp:Transcript_81459/g.242794  ORF Transcript_81459/g.242794 Transcript_81459/m.242794 type:complete len:263 (+) Transcript_81459:58-846(+)
MGGGQRRRLIVQQEAPAGRGFPECLPLAPAPLVAAQRQESLQPYEGKDAVGFWQMRDVQAAAAWQTPGKETLSYDQVEVEVPTHFAGILLGHPFELKTRVRWTCPGAHLDTLQGRGEGESAKTIFRVYGPGKSVDDAKGLIDETLLEAYRHHGIADIELQLRVASRAEEKAQKHSEVQDVAVTVDGEIEVVKVHFEKGPLWLQMDGSFNRFDRHSSGDFRWAENAAEWALLSLTEKEVLLVTTARRQRKINQRRWELGAFGQ